jgi:hypothetical protein
VREATLCPQGPLGRNRLPLPVHLVALLGWVAGAGCSDETRPGILIEVKVEDPDLRPQVVQFDWIAPGQAVLVRGELTPNSRPSDETFFGSLFIETRGPLDAPRVIALQGRLNDGEIVSGSHAVFPPSFEDFRSYRILLGSPLADADGNGLPDIIDRCTSPGAEATCAAPPDAGAPPTPDAPVEDAPPPSPDAPPDAGVPDAPDGRDGAGDGAAADGSADATVG